MPWGRTLGAWGGGALLLMAAAATAASSGPVQASAPLVTSVRFGVAPGHTRVVVESDKPLDPSIFTLPEPTARIVLDLPHVGFALDGERIGAGQRKGDGGGLVADYRFADFSAERSRIVLDLAEPARIVRWAALPPRAEAASHRLVVDLEQVTPEQFAAEAKAPAPPAPRRAEAPEAAPPGAHELVVVLDPGHGGDQPGAVGRGGTREKDVNLAIALAVRERLEAAGRYRVVMTREDDRRVELADRVRIARAAGPDLFLSIHADAARSGRSPEGASVYTLSDGAQARSRREILDESPRILDVDLTSQSAAVGDILVDFAQRDTRSQSTALAEALIPALGEAGPLLRNTHRSAGFYVLLAPDVPAVLLEAGFITNSLDEARLSSGVRRDALAAAVVRGIDAYFDQRERLYVRR